MAFPDTHAKLNKKRPKSDSFCQENLFQRSESVSNVTNRLVEMLDHVEKRVELLREHATAMERERDSLLSMINAVQSNKDLTLISEGEREEIEITAQRLLGRTLSVEVSVTTPRNKEQQKALNRVNALIDELLLKVRTDLHVSKQCLHECLNACLSDPQGPINLKFQAAIIECTADDQKTTRKRIEFLLNTVCLTEKNMHS